eukprot:TRINITY_DN9105_c0_g1_i1.p1 TRINITY_DN9105_c0_g1~~TRINITY_DN9105_c0_g1_i1.p1  ORF type:complete len:124 (-),score=9.62 TRINITY_DN9105_c0_g1_i1:3-374(-)
MHSIKTLDHCLPQRNCGFGRHLLDRFIFHLDMGSRPPTQQGVVRSSKSSQNSNGSLCVCGYGGTPHRSPTRGADGHGDISCAFAHELPQSNEDVVLDDNSVWLFALDDATKVQRRRIHRKQDL